MGTKRKQAAVDMRDHKNNILFPSEQHSDSACVVRSSRDENPLHYTLKIQSFSFLKIALAKSQHDRFESQIFNACGYKWKLALYPNGDSKRNGSNHISLYLISAEDKVLSTNLEINVVLTFLVYDNLKDKYLAIQDGKTRRFHAMKTEWGYEKLISLDTFNDASNGFLVDDCCAFGVDIFVKKSDHGKGEILSLVSNPRYEKYTWKITNFSRLPNTLKESDPFTVENYRWKIRLHPQGCPNTNGDVLSLYLIFDGSEQLPQTSKVYAEFEIAVLNQLDQVGPKKFTYNHWFEFGGRDFGWGTPNFMPLSDLKEPIKGFIRNDTLIVEVKINVISTSKIFL